MHIVPDNDDAEEFIEIVNRVIDDLIAKDAPPTLVLIKTNNWFGSKWLGFSGKVLGVMGVWNKKLTLPPFVPARILYQRKFAGPDYDEVCGGELIHRRVPSNTALTRRICEAVPGGAVLWFSGNTSANSSGCAMAYIPKGSGHISWYAGWARRDSWELVEAIGIKPHEGLFLRPTIPDSSKISQA